jgi:ankyrin repeat protein
MTVLKKQLLDQALLISAKANNLAEVKKYFAEGAALTAKDDETGNQALGWAVRYGNAEMAEFLLVHGADVKHRNTNRNTVLLTCIFAEQEHLVPLLLRYGCDANAQNPSGETPLMIATVKALALAEQALLQAPEINLNLQDNAKHSAIAYAVVHDRQKFLQDFIAAKADMRLKDNRGRSLVDIAKEQGHEDTAQYLASELQTRLSAENLARYKQKKPRPIHWQ